MNHLPLPAVKRLAEQKRTPFLAIYRAVIAQRVAEFQRFASQVEAFYALKANPAPQIVDLLNSLSFGFEISSEQELALLLRRGVDPRRIICSNPVKGNRFIGSAQRRGLKRFVLDSKTEADKLARFAPRCEVSVRLAVSNEAAAWPLDKKFGVNSREAFALLEYTRSLGLQPKGIAFHVGSQCLHPSSWQSALIQASELWRQANRQGMVLEVLNIGGGFPAHHQREVPSITHILNLVVSAVAELFPPGVKVVTEPGRAVVADAGWMVASVLGKARRNGDNWLYLDVGVFNGLTEALGGINYTFYPLGNGEGRKRWTIAGPSCDSLDVIGRGVELPEPEVGDRVAIFPAGAYTTAYASTFNGTRKPRGYLVED